MARLIRKHCADAIVSIQVYLCGNDPKTGEMALMQ